MDALSTDGTTKYPCTHKHNPRHRAWAFSVPIACVQNILVVFRYSNSLNAIKINCVFRNSMTNIAKISYNIIKHRNKTSPISPFLLRVLKKILVIISSCHDCREAGGWHLPIFFLLLLLVAKVAQKPRTAFLAGARVAKPKTNATRAKHLPSLFLHAFAPLARHDCTRQSLLRRQCKVRVYGAPTAQKIPPLLGHGY